MNVAIEGKMKTAKMYLELVFQDQNGPVEDNKEALEELASDIEEYLMALHEQLDREQLDREQQR